MSSLGHSVTEGSLLCVNIGNEKIELELKETLGKGAFGIVSRAVDNRGFSFALKSVLCHDIDTYEIIAQELDILLKLNHTNIVSMYGFDFHNDTAILIIEYCALGTLNRRLDDPVDAKLQLQWMEQLTLALAYLHDNNIVHRDLKTENVLLCEGDYVKITDFGVARHFVCCKRGRMDNQPNNYLSEYLESYMGTFAGTPFWIAPEVFDNKYTEKADIFSLGVIFHAICERQFCVFDGEKYYGTFTTYNGRETGLGLVMYEQQQLILPEFKETQQKDLIATISSMVHFRPESRISLIDVRVGISEAYCDVLKEEKPPTVIDTAEEHGPKDDESSISSLLQYGFCCGFRSCCDTKYKEYQQLS